jgi:hypothetical protein
MHPSLPLTGGCSCGRVRYEVRTPPLTIALCHCTICQARTGSAFSMAVPVLREGFGLTLGSTITRDLPGGSGALSTQHFCDHCLVRTHSEPHSSPTVTYLRPGTLDDRSWIQPVAQLWTRSSHAWACLDDIVTFEQGPTDPNALVKAYRER